MMTIHMRFFFSCGSSVHSTPSHAATLMKTARYDTQEDIVEPMEFKLRGEFIELCNLLKLVGLADSGGRGKAMVAEGLIMVDGAIETRKTAKIRAGQTVTCGEASIKVTA